MKYKLHLYNNDITQFYSMEHFYESINYYKSSGIFKPLIYLQHNFYPQEPRKESDKKSVSV